VQDEGGWALRYSTGGHTAELVPLFAAGTGAAAFSGLHTADAVGRLVDAAVFAGASSAAN
jgi:alkaline phosphatase